MMGGPSNGHNGPANVPNRTMVGHPQNGSIELKGPPNGPPHSKSKAGVRSVHTPHKADNVPGEQKTNHPDP